MSPAWIAAALTAAGVVTLAYMAPRATAAEPERQPPRAWAIERCLDERCEVLGSRYSGPTACAVDAASERLVRQQPSGVRLACIKFDGRKQ